MGGYEKGRNAMPLKLVAPRKGKTPYYYIRGTYLGRYVEQSTKTTERKIATAILRRTREQIERGELAEKGEPTFLSAAVAYMEAGGERKYLSKIVEYFRDAVLSEIDQAKIDECAAALYPSANSQTRNRQVYTPISAVLKHVGAEFKIKRPKGWRGNQSTFWLWEDQAFALLEAAHEVDAEFGIFLIYILYTGLRISEACGAKIDDLRLQESLLYIRITKNGLPRPVYLPPIVVAAMANHPRGLDRQGERIFKFTRGGRLYNLLKLAKEKTGINFPKRFGSFHMFCHTWGTWMRQKGGLDERGLIATGRWASADSVRRYMHTTFREEATRADLLPVPPHKRGGTK